MKKPKDFSMFLSTSEEQKEANDDDLVNRRIYKETSHLYIIKESKTAKEVWARKKRDLLLKLIRQWKIKWLLSYSPDRQARNMIDWWTIIEYADQWLVDLKYHNFHFNNNASWRMMLWFWFVFSKQYSDKLSEDINRWNEWTVEKRWQWRWDYSYWYYTDEDSRLIRPHQKYFPLMKKAFQMKLYDKKSNVYIADRLNAHWYIREFQNGRKEKVKSRNLWDIRKKRIYYWVYENWENSIDFRNSDLNPYFEPIITEDEYYILNPIDSSKKEKVRTIHWKEENYEIRPYTQWMVTTIDWYAVTPTYPNPKRFEKKLQKLLDEWKNITMADVREPNQIRCECKVKQSKYHKLAIPYSEIEQVIISLLSTIEISDDDYEEYRKFVCNELEKIRKKNVEENASIQRDINRVKSEKKKYIERNMWQATDAEEKEIYNSRRQYFDSQVDILRQQIQELDLSERDSLKEFEIFVDILRDSAKYFESATYVQKRKITNLFFLNIIITPEKTVAIEVREWLHDIFSKNTEVWRWPDSNRCLKGKIRNVYQP